MGAAPISQQPIAGCRLKPIPAVFRLTYKSIDFMYEATKEVTYI